MVLKELAFITTIAAKTLVPNINTAHLSDYDKKEIHCLAKNIYFESAEETIKGQIAVAHVTRNRVNHASYPKTYCEVIYQTKCGLGSKGVKNGCTPQFSWVFLRRSHKVPLHYKDGSINKEVVEKWYTASEIAILVYYGLINDPTKGATHFYNASIVRPQWVRSGEFIKVGVLGSHTFGIMRNGI